jgi:hypothetical protein
VCGWCRPAPDRRRAPRSAIHVAARDHPAFSEGAIGHDLAAHPHDIGHLDDRVLTRLAVDFRQQHIGLVIGEEAATRNRRQLTRIAQHQDRRAEGEKIAAELLVHHRAFIDDDQIGLRASGL